jgi:hypothetical protein
MTDQLQLPLDVRLEPTIAMREGDSRVDQCAWCGLLACHETAQGLARTAALRRGAKRTRARLGACPACGRTEWWPQDMPVGPFRRAS